MGTSKMTNDLNELLELARNVKMTPESKQRQRISFAFGNANIENEDVTLETVIKMARKLDDEAK